MISSKAVYVDDAGNHSNSDEPPRFDGPITRDAADDRTGRRRLHDAREGYGANKVAAERVLLDSGLPVTRAAPVEDPRQRRVAARASGSSSSGCSTGVRPSCWRIAARASTTRPRRRTSPR